GVPTAWWVNFGSYVRGAEGDAPYLVGFTGFGTLGGGNLSMRTGGDAGNIAPRGDGSIASSGNLNPRSQGLVLAVAGTGRLTSVLFQGVVVSFASYFCWFWLLRRYLANNLAI
ncbi:hypothetical protein, partial [Pseudomonas aeruginosa]|uniref:hypothetical protein n=1 Tax=Pseudomonas aeruginosa TaxID=287 RepID=UPI003CE8ACFA